MIRKIAQNRIAFISLLIVGLYAFFVLIGYTGILPVKLSDRVGPTYAEPSWRFWLGTDYLGRDVLSKVLFGARVAFSVGIVASAIAIPIGACLGALAAFFGGKVDDFIVWLYSTVSSVPQILLLTSISFVLGRGITSIYIAVGLTSWVGICRTIRGEVLKLKKAEYVIAAKSIGSKPIPILIKHILPNVLHLLIIDFSLRFVYAIKSEAILSYLGLGVQGEPSWGVMIADSKDELIRGIWWQLAGATAAMFFLVLALNLLGDALRDILDPRLNEA